MQLAEDAGREGKLIGTSNAIKRGPFLRAQQQPALGCGLAGEMASALPSLGRPPRCQLREQYSHLPRDSQAPGLQPQGSQTQRTQQFIY